MVDMLNERWSEKCNGCKDFSNWVLNIKLLKNKKEGDQTNGFRIFQVFNE